MSWRPKDWIKETQKAVNRFIPTWSECSHDEREIFEAGADAILEAACKKIEKGLLTKEERDAVYDNLSSKATCGEERIAFCQAQLQKILDLFKDKEG